MLFLFEARFATIYILFIVVLLQNTEFSPLSAGAIPPFFVILNTRYRVTAGWKTGVWFPVRVDFFSVLPLPIDNGAYLASYPVGIVASFFPSIPRSSIRPLPLSASTQNSVYISHLFHAYCMLRPNINTLFIYPNIILEKYILWNILSSGFLRSLWPLPS